MKTATIRLSVFVLFIFLLSLLTIKAQGFDLRNDKPQSDPGISKICTGISDDISELTTLISKTLDHKTSICSISESDFCEECRDYHQQLVDSLGRAHSLNHDLCGGNALNPTAVVIDPNITDKKHDYEDGDIYSIDDQAITVRDPKMTSSLICNQVRNFERITIDDIFDEAQYYYDYLKFYQSGDYCETAYYYYQSIAKAYNTAITLLEDDCINGPLSKKDMIRMNCPIGL